MIFILLFLSSILTYDGSWLQASRSMEKRPVGRAFYVSLGFSGTKYGIKRFVWCLHDIKSKGLLFYSKVL